MIELLTRPIILQILLLGFLAILFLQSGLDKVFNYQANKDWLTEHFSNSPLRNTIGLLMPVITIMEVAAGIFSLLGIGQLLLQNTAQLGLLGAQLSAFSILSLFFGQRIAKDYEGAGNLVPYFLVCLAAIYVLMPG